MRIIQISNDYFNSAVYRNLQSSLIKNGVDSYFLVPSEYGGPDRNCSKDIIYARCFSGWDKYFFYHKQKKVYQVLKNYIQALNPDFLHGHFLFSGGYACYKAKKEFGTPYLVTIQNTDLNIYLKYMVHLRKLGINILLDADYVIFISTAYLNQLIDKYVPQKYKNTIKEKSRIIPFPIDDFWIQNSFADRPHNKKSITKLITAGVVSPNKNQITVAKAAKLLILKGYDIEYLVIGKIIDKAYYNELMKYPFVKHVPQCSKEELINYYREADVFVLTSIYESFGMVYPEAMSQGLPVIYSLGEGFDNQFPEGEVGYHACKTDIEDIARAIIETLKDYESISKRCINYSKNFSSDIICNHYINVYKDCLKKGDH